MFRITFGKPITRYVSPVKFKALQSNLNGAKVTIDFRYLVRFDDYDIKTSAPIDTVTTRTPNGVLRVDYSSFGSGTHCRAVQKEDIDDTYNVYKILEAKDDNFSHVFRTKLKHLDNLSRINHANINFNDDIKTFRAYITSNNNHDTIQYPNNYNVVPKHVYTMQDDDDDKVSYILRETQKQSQYGNGYMSAGSTLLCSFIDHNLLLSSSISITLENPDDDSVELTDTQIKDSIKTSMDILNNTFKEYGMRIEEMNVFRVSIEKVKDAIIYNNNKDLFYKFLDFIKKKDIKLTNTSLTGDSIYTVVGILRGGDSNTTELMQFNMAKKAFDICVYTDTINSQKHITQYVFEERISNAYKSYQIGAAFHLGTNDINVVKRMYLMTTQNDKLSYVVTVPVDIFTKDLERIRELVENEK